MWLNTILIYILEIGGKNVSELLTKGGIGYQTKTSRTTEV
jgi:hypothetical protein